MDETATVGGRGRGLAAQRMRVLLEQRAAARREQIGPPPTRTRVVPIDVTTLDTTIQELMAQAGVTRLTRNSRCPCGSGKRFKRCCGRKGK